MAVCTAKSIAQQIAFVGSLASGKLLPESFPNSIQVCAAEYSISTTFERPLWFGMGGGGVEIPESTIRTIYIAAGELLLVVCGAGT